MMEDSFIVTAVDFYWSVGITNERIIYYYYSLFICMFYFLIFISVIWIIIIIIIIIIANCINLHVYFSHFHLCVWNNNDIIIIIIMLFCVCNLPCSCWLGTLIIKN
jgi:hypothetical protein